MAGTELDMGFEGDIAPVPSSAHPEAEGGTTPPERKVGQGCGPRVVMSWVGHDNEPKFRTGLQRHYRFYL